MVPSPLCNFCNNVVENIKHLIWDCPRSREAWQSFNLLTRRCYNINYVNYESIILGSPNPILLLEAIVVEILKIILKKDRNERITEDVIKNLIRMYYKIERIAMRKDIIKFEARWQNFEQALNPLPNQ
jgi:hypothetical protein